MSTPDVQMRRLTTPRVIGLVVVALLAGALVLLVSGGGHTVRVPPGAKAGQAFLHPCTYSTEAGKYAADCGTLVVPENRQNPASRLIALPVTRYPATRLLERVWELRGELTPYDASYVALAEALQAPIVTTDEQLGRSHGHHATVVCYPA